MIVPIDTHQLTLQPVPPFFLPLLENYMRQWPGDTNFIVEFAEKGKPSRGGNGFGTITCMEDYCWKVSQRLPPQTDPT